MRTLSIRCDDSLSTVKVSSSVVTVSPTSGKWPASAITRPATVFHSPWRRGLSITRSISSVSASSAERIRLPLTLTFAVGGTTRKLILTLLSLALSLSFAALPSFSQLKV